MTIHQNEMIHPAHASTHQLTFNDYTFEAYGFRTRSHHIEYGEETFVRADIGQPTRPLPRHHLDMVGHKKARLRTTLDTIQVTWRSMDGKKHETQLDLAQIFKERRIHHDVRAEDVWHGERIRPPAIILVVDDRDVLLYMKAMIPLRERSDARNPYSAYRRKTAPVARQSFL